MMEGGLNVFYVCLIAKKVVQIFLFLHMLNMTFVLYVKRLCPSAETIIYVYN